MTAHRLSRLQRRILAWLLAEECRTKGTMAADHRDLARALAREKAKLRHHLADLERKGLVTLTKTPGGQVEAIDLTPAGRQIAASCE